MLAAGRHGNDGGRSRPDRFVGWFFPFAPASDLQPPGGASAPVRSFSWVESDGKQAENPSHQSATRAFAND